MALYFMINFQMVSIYIFFLKYCVFIPRILKSCKRKERQLRLDKEYNEATEKLHVHTTDVTKSLACALSIRRLARLTSWATVLGMLRLPPRPLSSHCSIRQTWPSFQGDAFNWVENKSNSTAQIHVTQNNILKYGHHSEWIFLVYTRLYFWDGTVT